MERINGPRCTHVSHGDPQLDPYLVYPINSDVRACGRGTQLNTPRWVNDVLEKKEGAYDFHECEAYRAKKGAGTEPTLAHIPTKKQCLSIEVQASDEPITHH